MKAGFPEWSANFSSTQMAYLLPIVPGLVKWKDNDQGTEGYMTNKGPNLSHIPLCGVTAVNPYYEKFTYHQESIMLNRLCQTITFALKFLKVQQNA